MGGSKFLPVIDIIIREMEESKDWENIARHLKGKPTEEERDKLLHWLKEDPENESKLQDIEQLWDLAKLPDEGINPNVNNAWQKFSSVINENDSEEAGFFSTMLFKIAASVILVLGVGYFLINNPFKAQLITIQTSAIETKEIQLSDGSVVWLNKNSKITYSEEFNVEDRLVNLSGEAFFEVKKAEGKRFTILSNNAKTEVLGTQFNVRAYDGEPEVQVTVVKGKVSFSPKNDAETVYLESGDKGLLEKDNTLTKTITENNNETAWKTKKLSFNNTQLTKVFSTLEGYFGTDIFVNNGNILHCKFTGTFDNPDLNQIIEILSISVDIKYKKQGKTYYFSGKGCK